VLKQSAGVKDGVVTVNESNGEKRLVGYIVAEGKFDKEATIAHIRTKLPDYMTPKIIVEVNKIPLTANGKADRKACLRLMRHSIMARGRYVEPATEWQIIIAETWCEVLRLKKNLA